MARVQEIVELSPLGRSQSALKGPFLYSFSKRTFFDSYAHRPIFYAHRNSVVRNNAILPSVSTLLCSCSPTAIARLIIAVVVDALKRGVFRPFAHVLKKHREGFPSIAYANPTTSVMNPAWSILIAGTTDHSRPRIVSFAFAFSVAKIWINTSARFDRSAKKIMSKLFDNLSAITLAQPSSARSVDSRKAQYRKLSKSEFGQIFNVSVHFARIAFSHLSLLAGSLVRVASGPLIRQRLDFMRLPKWGQA